MLFSDTISTAFEGLQRNKSRSLLTTLGIIIGVGSVILMVSIGASFERYILDQVEQFGGDLFEVYAKGLEQFGKDPLSITFGDVEAIRNLSTVKSVAPVIFVAEDVRYGDEELSPMIFGTSKEIFTNFAFEVEKGRMLTDDDIDGARAVAVLGSRAAEEIFPNEDPLGKRINIGARKFTVVGVLEELGSLVGQSMDTNVYVPFTIAKAMMGRTKYVDYVSLQAEGSVDLAQLDITSLLRQRHRINNPEDDPDKDDFFARSTQQALDVITSVTLGLTIFLGLIAGISLLVGGIGIMNIMLVSVSERTKEIGLRKAVGARKHDILLQFLLEAISLTFVGGIIGILGGVSFGYLLSLIAAQLLGEFNFALSINAVLLATAMAVGTGLAFGIYPAKKASELSPIEAMRYE